MFTHQFNNKLLSHLILVGITLLITSAAMAQVKYGTIGGVVQDPTEGVIPGANVKATNQDTGSTRETITSDAGVFRIANLLPGKYTVAITITGFKAREFKDVEVLVGRENDLGIIKLEVGQVTEVVGVEAAAPLMESSTPQISATYDNKKLVNLPISPTGVDYVALLTPGVIPGFGNVNSNGVTLSVNGQRARANNFTLDGQDNNDLSIGGPGIFIDQPDILQEFQIVTNQFNAEYGRNAGAQVNLSIKSGTNAFHGSVYEYHQNASALNAMTNKQRARGDKKPPVSIDNLYGFTLGGPIQKERIFFFGNFQQEKVRQQNTVQSSDLTPTPAGIQTLLSNFPNSIPVRVLSTAGPFARPLGNPQVLPGSQTNIAVQGVPVEFGKILRILPTPINKNQFITKVDTNLNEKTFLSTRYIFQQETDSNATGDQEAGYIIDVPSRSQGIGISLTRQFTPRASNEFRFNYGRLAVAFEGGNTAPFSAIRNNLTNFNMPANILNFGLPTNLPQFRIVNNYQYQDHFTFSKGKHTFKAGVDFRRILTPLGFLPFVNGRYNLDTFDNFVDNMSASVNFAAGDTIFHVKEFNQFYYFQDDWKITPTLTLNLGIRYENFGQAANRLHELSLARETGPGRFWNPNLPLEARIVPKIQRYDRNWAPRVGFAWAPEFLGTGKTVFRGGYGIAYDPSFFNILLNMQTSAPFVFAFSVPGASAPPVPPGALGQDVANVIVAPLGVSDPRRAAQTQMTSPFKNPMTQFWSFGVQREVTRRTVVEIRYAGNHTTRLFQSTNTNPLIAPLFARFPSLLPRGVAPAPNGRINPDFGVVRLRCNCASGNYHALQTRFDGTLWYFTFSTSYTYSKAIDNVSEIFTFTGAGSPAFSQNPLDFVRGERGRSNFDRTHVFSSSIIWEIPAFKEQVGAVGKTLGGWQLSAIIRSASGQPYTPLQNRLTNGFDDIPFNSFAIGTFSTLRPFPSNPNAAPGTVGFACTAGVCDRTGRTIDPNSVRYIVNDAAAVSRFGTPYSPLGRNTRVGQRFNRVDFAIFKNTKIAALGEQGMIQFRAEFQNAFNHPFFGVPNVFVDRFTTGVFENLGEKENAPAGSAIATSGATPRTIRFGLRLAF